MVQSAENCSMFCMKLCDKPENWQIDEKIGKKFVKNFLKGSIECFEVHQSKY